MWLCGEEGAVANPSKTDTGPDLTIHHKKFIFIFSGCDTRISIAFQMIGNVYLIIYSCKLKYGPN